MKDVLTLADNFAKNNSTCKKTAVGCYIVNEDPRWRTVLAKGCNNNREKSCKEIGCLREEVFGSNSKAYRDQCRCYGNHAERDALLNVQPDKMNLVEGATAFVTRYPCDPCTSALATAGIKRIVYGREFEMSDFAKAVCEKEGIEVIHIADWNCDENDTNN
jgi:deoxycytidylate deaminase